MDQVRCGSCLPPVAVVKLRGILFLVADVSTLLHAATGQREPGGLGSQGAWGLGIPNFKSPVGNADVWWCFGQEAKGKPSIWFVLEGTSFLKREPSRREAAPSLAAQRWPTNDLPAARSPFGSFVFERRGVPAASGEKLAVAGLQPKISPKP